MNPTDTERGRIAALPPRPAPALRPMFAAFRLMSSAAAVTVVLGALTNKAIAVTGGPEGIALMGLYRQLGALITRPLLLGYDTILVRRLSRSRSDTEASVYLGLAAWLMAAQGLVALAMAAFLAGPLASWLFGSGQARFHVVEVRVVVAMGFVNLVLQMITAALNGRVALRAVTLVGLATSVSTLVLIVPLMKLGRVGLAWNVGLGSLVGVALGLVCLVKEYGPRLRPIGLRRAWESAREGVSGSAILTLHPFLMMTAMLTVQSLVNRGYGVAGLGAFNAAMAVVDIYVLVVMSAVRSYFLPSLGRIDDAGLKREFVARVLGALFLVVTATTAALVLSARPVFWLLFSARFRSAADVFTILCMSNLGQVLVWVYNSDLINRGRFGLVLAIDSAWAVGLVGSTLACVSLGLPLSWVGWSFVASYLASGAFYAAVCSRLDGQSGHGPRDLWAGLFAVVAVGAGCGVYRLDSRAADVIYAVAVASGVFAA